MDYGENGSQENDMTHPYIQDLFHYNFAMNQRMIDQISTCHGDQKQMIIIFAHTLTAEKIWLMRLCQEDLSGQKIWPGLSLNDCLNLLKKNKQSYKTYLIDKTEENFTEKLIYKTSKGIEFQTPVIDILMHVVIHSGYHRGQIAALLRREGNQPENTDYIHYVRFLKENSR
jgi:uncharacterized damage-inducible protein DinB